jgi:hypothetical protein
MLLANSTMAMFSPLCVASGRVPRAVTWLLAAGFEVPCVFSLQLHRKHVVGLWAHLIPRLPQRRVDVVIEALTAGPSVLVGLRRPSGEVSAAEHLSEIKGSADPSVRHESSLRSYLGAPNLLTSLVHTPDGPEDLLRELQVLLRGDELDEFWQALRTGPALGADSLPSFVSGEDPPPAIDALVVALRLRARLLAGDATACRAHEQLEFVVAGRPFDLDVLTDAVENSQVVMSVWDRVVLASEWVAPSPRPGDQQTSGGLAP